jgi:hypothetical protein
MSSFEENWIEEIYEPCVKGELGCKLLKSADVALAIRVRSSATVSPSVYSVTSALKVLGYKNVVTKDKDTRKSRRGYWMKEKVSNNNVLDGIYDSESKDDDLPF